MRFFLDTEFIESGPQKPIQLVSIGIVAEDGREYYAISREFHEADASPWVRQNVLAQLEPEKRVARKFLSLIAREIQEFVRPESERPEFWADFCAYDWVVFCQIFGTMMDLPAGFPMYCHEIRQLWEDRGRPILPAQSSAEHNALNDARWNKLAWEFLDSH